MAYEDYLRTRLRDRNLDAAIGLDDDTRSLDVDVDDGGGVGGAGAGAGVDDFPDPFSYNSFAPPKRSGSRSRPPAIAVVSPAPKKPPKKKAKAKTQTVEDDGSSLGDAWRTLTFPLRSLTGITGGLGGQLGRAFDPAGYDAARAELVAQETAGGGDPDDPSSFESAAALPGLGDVVAQNIPTDGVAGRLLRPVTQLGLNILGDPTSYVGVGLLPKLSKVGKLTADLGKAQRAMQAADKAGDLAQVAELGAQIPTLAGRLAQATEAETAIGRGARALEDLGDIGATGKAVRSISQAGDFTSAARGIGRLGLALPFGPVPGIAYAPELVSGVVAGAQQTAEDLRGGRLAEAAASGVGTLMTTALGALVARGVMSEARALSVLEKNLASQIGEPPIRTQDVETLGVPVPPTRQAEAEAQAQAEVPPTVARAPVVESTTLPPSPLAAAPIARVGSETLAYPLPRPPRVGQETLEIPRTEVEPPAAKVEAPEVEATAAPASEPTYPEWFEAKVEAGETVTKKELIERGLVSKSAAKDARVEDLVEKVVGPGAAARMEHVPGVGYKVKRKVAAANAEAPVVDARGGGVPAVPDRPVAEAVDVPDVRGAADVPGGERVPAAPDAAAPTARPAVPAGPGSQRPTSIPRTEIARTLEAPENQAEADRALQQVADETGRPLEDLGPQDLREYFPGDEHKATRALLNHRLATGRKARRVAAEATEEVSAARPPAATVDPAAPAPAPAHLRAYERPGLSLADYTETPNPVPAKVPTVPREGPGGLDLVVPKAVDRNLPERPGPANFTDQADQSRHADLLASRTTSPVATGPGRPLEPPAPKPASRPLNPDVAQRLGERLAGGTDLLRPAPGSPIAKVQEYIGRSGNKLEDFVQNTMVKWMRILADDETRYKPLPDSPTEKQIASRVKKLESDAKMKATLERILADPDAKKSQTELTKLMFRAAEDQERSIVRKAGAQEKKLSGPEGMITVARENSFLDDVAEGLDEKQASRLAIHKDVTLEDLELKHGETPDPDYPDRGDRDVQDWRAEIASDPDIADGYRRALAWSLEEWKADKRTRTGVKGAAKPYMDVLRGIVGDLGVKVDSRRGADRLIKKLARELDEIQGTKKLQAAVTDLLTDQVVAQRGPEWERKIRQAPKVGDTTARVVDFEGDAPALVYPLVRASGLLVDQLSRATAAIAEATDLPSRFGGLTPSPQLSGLRIGDALYLNPVESIRRAVDAGRTGDDVALFAARDLTDTLFHEIAHRKARHDAKTGDQDFIEAYARAIEDSAGLYSQTIRDLAGAISAKQAELEALLPAYRKSMEATRERINRDGGGAGPRGLAPIKDRPGGDPRGADGGRGDGVRPSRDIPEGGEGAAGGGGRSTPAGAGDRAGAAGQPAGSGVGAAGARGAGGGGEGPRSGSVDPQTKTPAFKQWFRKSRILDERGQPLQVYHGTPHDFEAFDPNKAGSNLDDGFYGRGMYFSDNQSVARAVGSSMSDKPGRVITAYLSIQKPFEMEDRAPHMEDPNLRAVTEAEKKASGLAFDERGRPRDPRAWSRHLRAKGYDGITVYRDGGQREFVAFYPTQIKSATSNSGAFNPDDARVDASLTSKAPDPKMVQEMRDLWDKSAKMTKKKDMPAFMRRLVENTASDSDFGPGGRYEQQLAAVDVVIQERTGQTGASLRDAAERDLIARAEAARGTVQGHRANSQGPGVKHRVEKDAEGEFIREANGTKTRLKAWELLDLDRDPTSKPSASLTTLASDAINRKRTADSMRRIGQAFAESMARYSGQPKEAAADILKRYEEIAKLSPEEKGKLAAAKPQGASDIGLNLSKFADALSEDQIGELAQLLAVRNVTFSRATPMKWEHVDTEMRKLLDLHTPEEFIKFTEKSGLRSPADFAFMRAAVATFGKEMDVARDRLRAAEIRKDPDAAAAAKDRLQWSAAQRDAAIGLLIPETTNAARILAFQRIAVQPLGPGENFRSRFFGAMRASGIKKPKQDELYQLFSDTLADGGEANWSRFATAFREATRPRGFDKFLEFWKAGLLGYPTQIVNAASNVVFGSLRLSENSAAALINAGISKVTGAPQTRHAAEIGARSIGLRDALGEILPILREDFADILSLRAPNISKRIERGSFADDPNLRQLQGAIEGKTGEFIRIPFKLLDTSDNVVKHMVRTMEYGAHAARMAHDKSLWTHPGEGVQHATSRIYGELRKVAQDPFSNYGLWSTRNSKGELVYRNALEAAKKTMLEDVFQAPLGKTMGAFNKFVTSHPALEMLFPFRKTPYNILEQGMKRTLLGAAFATRKYAAGEIDRPELVEAWVKSGIGSAIMATTAMMAMDGLVTGGGPTDQKQKELLKRTGWQPYSIKAGDQYLSYARIEPLATILGLAADLAEAWKRKDLDTGEQIMAKLGAAASDNVLNKTFLQGLESALDLATGSKPGGRAAALRSFQASLIPNVVGVVPVAHLARATDPNYRETEAGTLSPFQAQIPGASKRLPAQYGPTGEPRMRPGHPLERLLSPIARSTVKTDPIAVASGELVRLGRSMEKPPMFTKIGDEKIYYTADEREEIGQAQQRMLTEIARAMKDPGYAKLPDGKELETGGRGPSKSQIIARIQSRLVAPVSRVATAKAVKRAQDTQESS